MFDVALVEQCTTEVAPQTMQTLIDVESSGNPFAIAAVGVDVISTPEGKEEAIESAKSLMSQGYNISLGLGQINMHNFEALGLTLSNVFDPCTNIQAADKILSDCYQRAAAEFDDGQRALQAAFSCYYSNNFSRGFEPDDSNGNSYVQRVAASHERLSVPQINFDRSDIDDHRGGETSKQDDGNTEEEPHKEIRAIENFESSEKGGWDVFQDFTG
ncbi:lytic transglycosylase domain-containing protein [Kushneria indalinina]|uniref:Transglycosylase-like protein with SLT domain n=1 Tax=Kushneria indalinina DSM 14324 TaxID=1122140 RepID=A0A3D9DRN3_9GAMM|nr:lytic transglycosylase domain-containing protein [Kushneria indalinina]REC93321.1 transglycosylase-like protein with SLT domain [Kushneria indalinina DSM 14324]